MRDLNVSDLPPRHETGHCEEVIRVIGKAMITCRHHIKEKVRTAVQTPLCASCTPDIYMPLRIRFWKL